MSEQKFLDAALGYIDQGFSVVILGKESKEPVTAHTPNGLKDATRDPEKAREWWTLTPKCNVGAVLGAASGGIVAIDIDRKHGVDGYEAMRDWELEHGNLPDTAICYTPTGGFHLYYKVDREVRPSTNDKLGVDIRGDDSYTVLPPSVHPDTRTEYIWEQPPDEVPIAEANELVYEFIDYARPDEQKADGNGGEAARQEIPEGDVDEGGRNEFLFKQGRSARGRGADDDTVAAFLESLNKMKCKPPVSDAELWKIIGSVCSVPPGMSAEVKAKVASRKSANHVSVSRVLLDKYSACFLDGAPAVYDGLSYRIGWDSVERAILREWPNSKDRDRKEVVKYLTLTMPREEQSPPRFIGFRNGVLDIETMELMSFSPEFRIPNVIPHDWNPDARSDVLDGMLRRVACGDPFIESNLVEFMGLCMYRSGKYAFAAILLGKQNETASNGKSTYIDMIRNVLGEDNYSSLSLRALGERFNQQYLSGKLANLGDDISSEFTDGSSLEVFKKAVAGSKISTDVKNSKGYEFVPYCTMMFSANRFPKMEKLDDGTLRRLFPIRFNAHFTKADPDFDPDIGEKLKSEECCEAAIVRGVWGLRRVIAQRGPTDNDESKRMLRDIETDNSTILQWIDDDFVEREWLFERETRDAYQRYSKWCDESGVRKPYGKNQFSADICAKFGFKVQSTRRNGRPVRVFTLA